MSAVSEAEPIGADAQPKLDSRWPKPSTLLKLAITVIVSAVLLEQAGVEKVVQTLRHGTNWGFVGLGISLAAVAMTINSARWQLMLRGQGADVSLASLVRLYLVGMFFNNVLPGRFGGDLVRAYGVSLSATSKTRSLAAVLMDRLVGAISVLVIAVAAIRLDASHLPDAFLQLTLAGFAASIVLLVLMLYRNDSLATLRLRVLEWADFRVFGLRVRPRLEAALNALRGYSRARGTIIRGFLFSLVANGVSMVNIWLYARAVNADAVGLGDVATIAPYILAIGVLPISFNGLGTIEATFVVLFGFLGVDKDVAVAIAILRRLALLVLSLAGGLLYAVRRFS